MKPARRGAPAALALAGLLLAGCASVPRPGGAELLGGRLSIRVEAEPVRAFSAAFELEGNATQGRFALTSPLGTTVAEARWKPGEALLTRSDGVQPYPDLDSLAEQALGERVPMAALFHWLRGQPWPEAPSQPLPGGEAGFTQVGWRIGLARFADGWVDARRDAPPVVTVRARLDRP